MHSARRPLLIAVRGLDPVGTGRQAELLALGLAASGRDLHVAVTSTGSGIAPRLRAAGIPVHEVGRRPLPDVAAAVRLAALARRLRAGVVVSFGRRQAALAAAARLAVPGLRAVVHAAVPARTGRAGRVVRAADAVVAASDEIAESIRRCGVADRRVATVPPGIAADATATLPREAVAERLGLDPECQWTLSVAPLVAEARLERLIWGIDQLGVVRRGMQHVLVGSGPQLKRILRRARVQELAERLFVFPRCPLLPDLLGQITYAWQSGETPFGGAILDAMARGVPVVAVTSAAVRQLVAHGETGWIVPADPESEFPRRAFTMLENPDEMARFAAAARARAAEVFPVDRMVAGFAAAIDDLA
jgi:glycosyltransferase involved in cell wall biosynthesis